MIYLIKSEIIRINKIMTLKFGGLFLSDTNLKNESSLDYTLEIMRSEMLGAGHIPKSIRKQPCICIILLPIMFLTMGL